mmetsp:Transcript_45976/g.106917  ORF Transcript_45976/g.106917 Transcript_45976/m.106917 type:complete len:720 (-) Transcript_45976:38-2197(-)
MALDSFIDMAAETNGEVDNELDYDTAMQSVEEMEADLLHHQSRIMRKKISAISAELAQLQGEVHALRSGVERQTRCGTESTPGCSVDIKKELLALKTALQELINMTLWRAEKPEADQDAHHSGCNGSSGHGLDLEHLLVQLRSQSTAKSHEDCSESVSQLKRQLEARISSLEESVRMVEQRLMESLREMVHMNNDLGGDGLATSIKSEVRRHPPVEAILRPGMHILDNSHSQMAALEEKLRIVDSELRADLAAVMMGEQGLQQEVHAHSVQLSAERATRETCILEVQDAVAKCTSDLTRTLGAQEKLESICMQLISGSESSGTQRHEQEVALSRSVGDLEAFCKQEVARLWDAVQKCQPCTQGAPTPLYAPPQAVAGRHFSLTRPSAPTAPVGAQCAPAAWPSLPTVPVFSMRNPQQSPVRGSAARSTVRMSSARDIALMSRAGSSSSLSRTSPAQASVMAATSRQHSAEPAPRAAFSSYNRGHHSCDAVLRTRQHVLPPPKWSMSAGSMQGEASPSLASNLRTPQSNLFTTPRHLHVLRTPLVARQPVVGSSPPSPPESSPSAPAAVSSEAKPRASEAAELSDTCGPVVVRPPSDDSVSHVPLFKEAMQAQIRRIQVHVEAPSSSSAAPASEPLAASCFADSPPSPAVSIGLDKDLFEVPAGSARRYTPRVAVSGASAGSPPRHRLAMRDLQEVAEQALVQRATPRQVIACDWESDAA